MKNSVNSKASLKLPQIIALYIGSVLGSGILIIPGVAAEVSGPASLLAWGLMTLLVFPMALTMGLQAAKYPNAGGVAYFVTRAFNSNLGSLTGWFLTMAVVVGAPVIALTGAGYLCAAVALSETWRIFFAAGILTISLFSNYVGMKLTGRLQLAVVLTTLTVLIVAITGSLSKINIVNFKPFIPNGWGSVGTASTILFWCFIGWEAVSNLSEEFKNPKRDTIRGTVVAAIIISIIYFLTALVIVGTHSYGANVSDASLVYIIKNSFGIYGAVIAGIAALFVCMAPTIAYVGATSRLVFSLSETGYAPKSFAKISKKFKTPLGGLVFLAIGFTVTLIIFSTKIVSISTLLQIPNATFILTYIGGCAAGIKLLNTRKLGVFISLVSLVLSVTILFFVKWNILYPAIITIIWSFFMLRSKKFKTVKQKQK